MIKTTSHNSRRGFLKWGLAGMSSLALPLFTGCTVAPGKRPNIILVMSDDQGWGDVGYNGNTILKTPHLDAMAREGIRFDRFYAAAPVCSPTRGSCLTGRHPYRYGIPWANAGHLPAEEITLAEVLKAEGYRTGHFGKWHLGTLSLEEKDSARGGRPDQKQHYSPPWENGFDTSFSTESWMPTYNPTVWGAGSWSEPPPDDFKWLMDRPVAYGENANTPGVSPWHGVYWSGPGQKVTDNLAGDDSRVIMDRALAFIDGAEEVGQPFFTVIWFHTPHTPLAAGNEHRAPYKDQPIEAQHWYGSLTAMDEQIGRLRTHLRKRGIADDTILWYCSDNGPSYIHDFNSAGPFRGKKATLYEGGIRVPALLEWPSKFKQPGIVNAPISTSDFYPTLLQIIGVSPADQPVLDGIDVLPLIEGKMELRPNPIAFQSPVRGANWEQEPGKKQLVLMGNRYKIYSEDAGKSYALYDLVEDAGETTDLASEKPQVVTQMKAALERWVESSQHSLNGADYR